MGLALATAGVLPGLAQTDGALRWSFSTLSTSTAGSIVSSPAVGPDGTLYVGVEVGAVGSATVSGRVFALTPAGVQKWVFTSPDWVESTPAVGADGTVYAGCWDGVLYALRGDTGAKRWEYKAGSFIASSPAVGTDGTVYVGAGSNLVAVRADGTLKWTFASGDWIDSSPAIGPDGTLYVGSWDNHLYAISADGVEKWRFATADNVSSSPAVAADGTVYVGSRDAKLYALRPDGTLKWSVDTLDTVEASPVLGPDGTVYVPTTGGRLIAYTSAGAEKWRFPAVGAAALNSIYGTPAVRANGSIVFGTSNNALIALRPDGTQLWRSTLGDWSDSSPLVTADGTIYVGCADKKIYSFTGTVESLATDWPQFRRDARRSAWAPLGAAAGTTGRMINLSVRTTAGADANSLIVGFVVNGAGTRSLLLRGVGPTLTQFGVGGVLANPRLTAYSGSTVIATNDDWGTATNTGTIATTAVTVGAFALPTGSLDAALLSPFAAGGYTVQVSGANGATGVALMEAYDAGGTAGARLTNVSARSAVSSGAGVLIAGFVVSQSARAVLVRGTGPALDVFGVPGTLADPQLKIFQGSQLLAENNDWSVAIDAPFLAVAAQRVGGFALPTGSRDAALLVTLPPGAYTAQVSGVGGTSGVALIEVYEVP